MKKISLFLLLLILVSCKSIQEEKTSFEVTSKKEVLFNDYAFEITKIDSDSRCPEGTNCIWAGELVVEVSVWQKNKDENLAWFSKFVPENKKVTSYKISPAKTEKTIELKEYKVKLILE